MCCLCSAASGTCSATGVGVALLWAHLLCNSEAHWAIIFPCSFKKDAKLCLLSWKKALEQSEKSPMILSTSWYITHSFLSQHLFWSTGKKSDFCLWFWILWVTFWGQETTLLLNDSFFFTWMGMCQIPDFILEKVKGGVWIFFCWPLSHDFLIKSLKAFGDEATPKTSQILVNLSLTFHKQITKDTQIPICTCTYYLSVQKWEFEVHKKKSSM